MVMSFGEKDTKVKYNFHPIVPTVNPINILLFMVIF